MIKEKLRRVSDLYNTYRVNEETLAKTSTKGLRASLRRQQVFLKEKIISSFRDIQNEMQPKLFVVTLIDLQGNIKTVIMRSETYDDIDLYVKLLQLIDQKIFKITSVQELHTIFEGSVNITITRTQ